MKTLKFLKDFREYKKGDVITFHSDHKADSILLVEGVAILTSDPILQKNCADYEDKMISTVVEKKKRGRKKYSTKSL